MKLTIFGATGGIGAELLMQALAASHEVTAAVRNPSKLAASRNGTRIVTVDLERPEPSALESAVAGADAVLSGVGPRPMAKAGVAEHGTLAIVGAMQATGVRRILVVSAAPISTVASPGRPHPPKSRSGRRVLHAESLHAIRQDCHARAVRRSRAHGGRAPCQRPGLDDLPSSAVD